MTWTDFDGNRLTFQNGDYVRINTPAGTALPFLSGYVRGFNLSDAGTGTKVAYELYKMGNNPLRYVKEECLERTSPPFDPGHAARVHAPGLVCGLCGWAGA